MRRRGFIATLVGAAAMPLAARAQQGVRPVIGFLNGASYALSAYLVKAFHKGLAETGFVEGQNADFEYRSADGQYNRLPALAADGSAAGHRDCGHRHADRTAGQGRDEDDSDRLRHRQRSG
jgi:hypothetical protein